jgi:lysophospholipase L1-like esterase
MIAATIAYAGYCLLILSLFALLGLLYYGWHYAPPVPPAASGAVRIACIGDSITCGALLKNRKENCYPARLEKMLGPHYSVRNFGANGHTVQKKAIWPYRPFRNHRNFAASSRFAPHIVLIMLGTNDSVWLNWKGIGPFTSDYRDLLRHYRSLPCRPQVYALTPPAQFPTGKRNNQRIGMMIQSIRELAKEMSIGVIDINAVTIEHPECFRFDGVHPDANGAKIIAEAVYAGLTS